MSSGTRNCCCSFILTLGFASLFMWLSLRPSEPNCSLNKFYIPALNKTLNFTKNTTLYFELKLENTNKDKGVYYDQINVTFFDGPSQNRSTIGNYTVPQFYQGHQKTAMKNGFGPIIDLDAMLRAVSGNESTAFRVDMVTKVRYKILFWKTKRHGISVGADVKVNDQGTYDGNHKKGIKLKSHATMIRCFCCRLVFLFNLFFSFLPYMCFWLG